MMTKRGSKVADLDLGAVVRTRDGVVHMHNDHVSFGYYVLDSRIPSPSALRSVLSQQEMEK